MKLSAIAAITAGAMLLSACSIPERMEQYEGKVETLEQLDSNTFQITMKQPWQDNAARIRESTQDYARAYCGKTKRGTQLLEGAAQRVKNGTGTEATLIFRCVGYMAPPPDVEEKEYDNSKFKGTSLED